MELGAEELGVWLEGTSAVRLLGYAAAVKQIGEMSLHLGVNNQAAPSTAEETIFAFQIWKT